MNRVMKLGTAGLFALLLVACGSTNSEGPELKFPHSPEEISLATETSRSVASVAGSLVEEALHSAVTSGNSVDAVRLASELASLEGVQAASPNDSGSVIAVRQSDGLHHNVMTLDFTDERWLPAEGTPGTPPQSHQAHGAATLGSDLQLGEFPLGRRAVILAAFQGIWPNRLNIDPIEALLSAAGFEVDTFVGEEVDLDRFRSEFLEQYHVVYIVTHGGIGVTHKGDPATLLLTRELVTAERTASLTRQERESVATALIDGKAYYALTPQWLNETTDQGFARTWIYANACEGSRVTGGEASLSAALTGLGAGGYSSYDDAIQISFSGEVSKALITRLASGDSLAAASDAVRSDPDLSKVNWLKRAVLGDLIDVSMLRSSQRINSPYHIINPDETVGNASLTPDRGVPQTATVFEVVLNARYSHRVVSVTLDIDNTGEHLLLERVNESLWRLDRLSAPTAERYPRVDTFTFTALDADNHTVGQGSTTFTIQAPAAAAQQSTVPAAGELWAR